MPNIDRNGKKILGNRGTLDSLGLTQGAKRRNPKRPSLLERRQLIEQGKEGMQETVQEKGVPSSPALLPKKKKKRLAETAKSTYGA